MPLILSAREKERERGDAAAAEAEAEATEGRSQRPMVGEREREGPSSGQKRLLTGRKSVRQVVSEQQHTHTVHMAN